MTLTIWQIDENVYNRISAFNERISKLGYEMDADNISNDIYEISIFPLMDYYTELSYEFVNKNWSLEQMIDLLLNFIDERKN